MRAAAKNSKRQLLHQSEYFHYRITRVLRFLSRTAGLLACVEIIIFANTSCRRASPIWDLERGQGPDAFLPAGTFCCLSHQRSTTLVELMNPPINCLQAQNSISHAAIANNAVSKASYTFGPITMDGSSLVLSRKAQTFNSEKH